MGGQDRRLYQRGLHFHASAKISQDGETWTKAEINDLSSSGLQLLSSEYFEIGELIWFDLTIQGFFSEFEVKVKGIVRRASVRKDGHAYGISFTGLSNDKKILIDENVQNDRPVGGNPYSFDM